MDCYGNADRALANHKPRGVGASKAPRPRTETSALARPGGWSTAHSRCTPSYMQRAAEVLCWLEHGVHTDRYTSLTATKSHTFNAGIRDQRTRLVQ